MSSRSDNVAWQPSTSDFDQWIDHHLKTTLDRRRYQHVEIAIFSNNSNRMRGHDPKMITRVKPSVVGGPSHMYPTHANSSPPSRTKPSIFAVATINSSDTACHRTPGRGFKSRTLIGVTAPTANRRLEMGRP